MSLPKVYTYIKCLKSKLGVDITSYSIKKVVLAHEMKLRLEGGSVDMNKAGKVLYRALSYPDLRKAFEKAIDFDSWKERRATPEVPILRSWVNPTWKSIQKEEEGRRSNDSLGSVSSLAEEGSEISSESAEFIVEHAEKIEEQSSSSRMQKLSPVRNNPQGTSTGELDSDSIDV